MDYKFETPRMGQMDQIVIDNIPFLVWDGQINNSYGLNIVEIIEHEPLTLKIIYSDTNLNIIKYKYNVLKKITQNPLVIINCSLLFITHANIPSHIAHSDGNDGYHTYTDEELINLMEVARTKK